jgi:hypothetical protein
LACLDPDSQFPFVSVSTDLINSGSGYETLARTAKHLTTFINILQSLENILQSLENILQSLENILQSLENILQAFETYCRVTSCHRTGINVLIIYDTNNALSILDNLLFQTI